MKLEDIRPELYTVWPDRAWSRGLTAHQRGLAWEHQHVGHTKTNRGCNACVCEDAF